MTKHTAPISSTYSYPPPPAAYPFGRCTNSKATSISMANAAATKRVNRPMINEAAAVQSLFLPHALPQHIGQRLDQIAQHRALAGHDQHVGRHTGRQLRRDGRR